MKKILIAGPCYADAQSIKKSLEKEFKISSIEVTKAQEAKNVLRQRKVDIIIVTRILAGDHSPGMDLLRYSKQNNPEVPVILLTRFLQAQKEALEKGAQASFDMDLLIGFTRPSMEENKKAAFSTLSKFLS